MEYEVLIRAEAGDMYYLPITAPDVETAKMVIRNELEKICEDEVVRIIPIDTTSLKRCIDYNQGLRQ